MHSFTIVAQREVKMSADDAKVFYAEHIGRPFFEGLSKFMTR